MIDQTDLDECVSGIVASCNGDLNGALKALMLVNEQLERELERIAGLAARPTAHTTGNALH